MVRQNVPLLTIAHDCLGDIQEPLGEFGRISSVFFSNSHVITKYSFQNLQKELSEDENKKSICFVYP